MFCLSIELKTSWEDEAVRLRRCPFPVAEEEERDRPRVAVARTRPVKVSAMMEGKDCLDLVEERVLREVVEVISRLEIVRERERGAVDDEVESTGFVVRRVPTGAAESLGVMLLWYSSASPGFLFRRTLDPG